MNEWQLIIPLAIGLIIFGYLITKPSMDKLDKRIKKEIEDREKNPRDPWSEFAELFDEDEKQSKKK